MPIRPNANATRVAPPKPRRTQAERTLSTQRKLIDGAIELLKRKRYVGFRIADVAEHAGVSKGAQTHHFPAKDMLVLQALEEVYRRTSARAMERVHSARKNADGLLEMLVIDSRDFFLGDDFLLSLDLMMVDPGSSLEGDVRRLAQQYRLPVEQAWLDALIEAGHPPLQSRDVVRLTFAIARGFGIRQLITGGDGEFESLMATWRRMAEAMLLLSASAAPPQQMRAPAIAAKRDRSSTPARKRPG